MPDEHVTTRLNDGEGLEIAHEEDFGIRRGEDGGRTRIAISVPGMRCAIGRSPPSSIQEYEDVFEQDEADDDRVAEVLDRFVEEGIGANADEAWVRETPDYLVAGILQAVKNAAGHEVFLAVQNEQVQETMGMLDRLDLDAIEDDVLDRLMKFGEKQRSSSTSSNQTEDTEPGTSPDSTPAKSDAS
jgi:hypothetical protein